jgi:circadian clock protein KaiC
MVLVRYVELRSRLYRLISLFKVREGAFDPTIREFEITGTGIVVGQPFVGVEGVLSGMAREAARSASPAPLKDGEPGLPVDHTVRPG